MQDKQIIQQGAEAIIYLDEEKNLVKERISKTYRLKELDEKIRKLRTRSETKLLEKAGKIISVPKVIQSDEKSKKIIMEFVEGKKLSEFLNNFSLEKQKEIIKQIGRGLAKLHNENLIHGDLTTSNLILSENKIYFIDFGLGYHSAKLEDKAVDIHLFKQALEAKHFLYRKQSPNSISPSMFSVLSKPEKSKGFGENWKILFEEFLKNYSGECVDSEKILLQLEKVEKRGRYRH